MPWYDGQKAFRAVRARRVVRCHYCERVLEPKTSKGFLAETRDHVVPACLGGTVTVKCCWLDNQLKGDLTPERWAAFMAAYPGWWKSFRTNREVTLALRGLG